MMELLNEKFMQNENATLKYRIHHFCNYIILSLSKCCSYLDEIAISVKNEIITLTVKTDFENRELFENDWKEILKYDFPKKEKHFLKERGISLKRAIVEHPFTDNFIDDLIHYYFKPEKSKNRYLFKYRPVNDMLCSLLSENSLWFANPSTFNDTFDCRCDIHAEPSSLEIYHFYYTKSQRNFSPKDCMEFFCTFEMPSSDTFLKDLEEYQFNKLAEKIGIYCFSETYNNKLMWAHYAEDAKGICLVFDTSIDISEGYHKFVGDKVKYRNGPVKKFYDTSGTFEITDILYTKSKDWEYEQEIREQVSIQNIDSHRNVLFDPKSLVGIIFGEKISTEDKQRIKNKVKELKKYNIEFIDSYSDIKADSILLSNNDLGLV